MITSKVNNAALDAFLATLDLPKETMPEPVLNQYRLAMANALAAAVAEFRASNKTNWSL